MITDRRYWEAVAEVTNAPQPAWVWRLGFSPAARRIVEALTASPQCVEDLSRASGYSTLTVKSTLTALMRLGAVERPTNYKTEPNIWYVKGAAHARPHPHLRPVDPAGHPADCDLAPDHPRAALHGSADCGAAAAL